VPGWTPTIITPFQAKIDNIKHVHEGKGFEDGVIYHEVHEFQVQARFVEMFVKHVGVERFYSFVMVEVINSSSESFSEE